MENQNYPEYNVNNIQEVEIFDNDLAKLTDDIETDKQKKNETALKTIQARIVMIMILIKNPTKEN